MFIIPMSNLPQLSTLESKNQSAVTPTAGDFADVFKDAVNSTKNLQSIADQDSVNLALGNVDNLAQVMINSAKASTAVSLTVDIASRAVTAYKEIMQMQV